MRPLKAPAREKKGQLAARVLFTDPQTGEAPGVTQGRNVRSRCRCSTCPAIHINSRSWLRSSSTHEPSDPPHRVVTDTLGLPFDSLCPGNCRNRRFTHTLFENSVGKKKVTSGAVASRGEQGFTERQARQQRKRRTSSLPAGGKLLRLFKPRGSST